MTSRTLVFSAHAIKRMLQRGFSEADVASVLAGGEVLESYPDDTPYPSFLLLGFVAGRAVHVVAADRPDAAETIVITVYEPDRGLWDATFRKRIGS
ncbi:DUF4258 domain-containing protein [Sorangium sp. So ce134]